MTKNLNKILRYRHSETWHISWIFVTVAIFCLVFADLSISTYEPWQELRRLLAGMLRPSFDAVDSPVNALMQTIAFALLGVAIGSASGFTLALIFHWRWIRIFCALIRAVHELFWALIFLQIFGLHPLTGLLAIAIPYTGIFAKVYSEILEEGDPHAYKVLSRHTGHLSAFFYARLPDLWVHLKTYTLYRLECGLRSSTVLGFVGLPTLGYILSNAFMEGHYAQAWAILILFYVLIATLRYWVRPTLIPFYLLAAPFFIANDITISIANITRFFTQDIIPTPIRQADVGTSLWQWIYDLLAHQAIPGVINTLVLTQIALVVMALFSLWMFPLVSTHFFNRFGRNIGHLFLVVLRSTPEYIIAFILLLLWGPSMLPAIVALALHNGAIVAHLMGRYSNNIALRQDHDQSRINLYGYEILPRIYPQFLAFIFYRWEIIFRETAILGILGITTLGFYIDSALQSLKLDQTMVLIAITALLNVGIDTLSRKIRNRLRLKQTIDY